MNRRTTFATIAASVLMLLGLVAPATAGLGSDPTLPKPPDARVLLADVPGIASVTLSKDNSRYGIGQTLVLIKPTPGQTDAQIDELITTVKTRLGSVGEKQAVFFWTPMIELAPGFNAEFVPLPSLPVASDERIAWVRWLIADGRATSATSDHLHFVVSAPAAQVPMLAVDLDRFTRATFDLSTMVLGTWAVTATDNFLTFICNEETSTAALSNAAFVVATWPGTSGLFGGFDSSLYLGFPQASGPPGGAAHGLTPADVAAGKAGIDDSLYSKVTVQLGLWYGDSSAFAAFATPEAQAIWRAVRSIPGIFRITVGGPGGGLDVQLLKPAAWRTGVAAVQRLANNGLIKKRPSVSLLLPELGDPENVPIVRLRPNDSAATLAAYSQLLRFDYFVRGSLTARGGAITLSSLWTPDQLTRLLRVLAQRTPRGSYAVGMSWGKTFSLLELSPTGVRWIGDDRRPLPPTVVRRIERAWTAAHH